MSLFHRHKWKEVGRWFVPPVGGEWEADRLTADMFYDASNGYTVVELRCDECGDVTSRKLRGDGSSGSRDRT